MAHKKAIFWTVKLWYGVMVLLLFASNAMSVGGVVNISCVFPPSREADTSDAPGGHAAANAEPPPMYWYPSFSSSFGQSIVDISGRSRKSDALSI